MLDHRFLHALAAALLVATLAAPSSAGAGQANGILLTVPEALELAFPECEVKRETHYLDEKQKKHAEKLAR